jgi:ABC-type sugar transport system ATPase subunit
VSLLAFHGEILSLSLVGAGRSERASAIIGAARITAGALRVEARRRTSAP